MRAAGRFAISAGNGLGCVSIRPGLIVLARMSCGASSTAATRENVSVAARLEAYAAPPAAPRCAAPDEKLMIRPPRAPAIIARAAACVVRNVPRQFTAYTRSQT